MAERPQYILTPWETEIYVQDLQISDLENVGTKRWFEFHKKLMLLNQQSILEITDMREESVKEWFVSFKKISVLIYEAIQSNIWKQKVFPLLIEINGEPANTFMLYSVFYHENIATSLLENVLFHSESAQTMDDSAIDLIDYAVSNITALLYANKEESNEKGTDPNSCLGELLEKMRELEFNIGMRCVSIVRYMAEFFDNLPLYILSRMLSTHDVPYLLVELIEKQPWKKKNEDGECMIYNGKWEKVNAGDEDKICRVEGQVWIGLREFLLNPKCAPYYEINEFRLSQLSKLQKYLHEHVLDQIAPLIELRRWLCHLSISSQSSNVQKSVIVEVIPQIKSSILEKHRKKWKKLARHQAKSMFTTDIQYIQSIAQILNGAYDLDKLDYVDPRKCFLCKEIASKRCSKCKEAWYCNRECQVKDWLNHKDVCTDIIKSKEAFGIKD